MTMPLVSILAPMRNEAECIASCLASLRAQTYPADRLEILVLDGESTDGSADLVADIAREDPRVRLLPNPGRTQSAGMNTGIAAAQGEIIVRADAHAVYGPDYVAICVDHLLAGRGENVGGLQRGVGTTPFTSALAVALATPLGAGNAPYRMAVEPRYADTVWLGAWRRETLLKLGNFNERLLANEDYELNCRLRKQGGRIFLDPALPSAYYPRPSLRRLWRQYFRYGIGKVQCLQLHPETLAMRQLAAPALMAGLIVAAALTPRTPLPLIAIAGFYLLVILLGSIRTAAQSGGRHLPFLPAIFLTIHFAWGIGFLWALLRFGPFPIRPQKIAETERLLRTGK